MKKRGKRKKGGSNKKRGKERKKKLWEKKSIAENRENIGKLNKTRAFLIDILQRISHQ